MNKYKILDEIYLNKNRIKMFEEPLADMKNQAWQFYGNTSGFGVSQKMIKIGKK